MLDPHPRAQLCLIIQQYSQNIIAEPKRCRGMLSDLAPHHRLENNLLITALEQKVAQELLQPSALIPINMQVDRLAKRLHDVVGIKEEFAYWAVESWALALGVNQSTVKISSTPQPVKEEKADSVETVRKKHPNAYAKWSALDDDSLRKKYAEGSTISELAKLLHRTEGAIQSRLTKLNIQPPLPTKTIPPSSTAQQRIGKFIVDNGVATDTETDLMWCRFAHGQWWLSGTASGDRRLVNWKEAFSVTQQFNQRGGYAGYTDWRLPTIDELKTLIDKVRGKSGNYIDADVFPNNSNWFWSSSPTNAYDDLSALVVNFKYGNRHNSYEINWCAIRLVRGVHKVAITPPPATVKTPTPPPVVAKPLPTPPPVVAKPSPTPPPVAAKPLLKFFTWSIIGLIFLATVYIFSGTQSENNNNASKQPLVNIVPALSSPQDETQPHCIKGNCINGRGTKTYPDGSKYIGQFKNGLSEGQGTLLLPNGDKYVGKFKQDRFQQ